MEEKIDYITLKEKQKELEQIAFSKVLGEEYDKIIEMLKEHE